MTTKITVIPGDGIGPEIMTATLRCLDALDCNLEYEFRQAGLVALEESGSLVPEETLQSIRTNRVALKGPLTTPVGDGFTSINVGLRKEFDLYANVRPVISVPGTRSRYENIDIITVNYIPKFVYVSRACGYKSIFTNNSIIINSDSDNWIFSSLFQE